MRNALRSILDSNTKGKIGIEVEAEFTREPNELRSLSWRTITDGSLRGIGYEYVLSSPVSHKASKAVIKELYNHFDSSAANSPRNSDNCSVHVHLNMLDHSLEDLTIIVCCYIILEPLLMQLCSDHRKGNLFCLQTLDSQFVFRNIERIYKDDCNFDMQSFKYGGINLSALRRYGSLEFRHLNFPVSEKQLNQWVDILLEIEENALRYYKGSAEEVVSSFSEQTFEEFVERLSPTLLANVDIDVQAQQDMFESLRKLQPAIYNLVEHKNIKEMLLFGKGLRIKKMGEYEYVHITNEQQGYDYLHRDMRKGIYTRGEYLAPHLSSRDFFSELYNKVPREMYTSNAMRDFSDVIYRNKETIQSIYKKYNKIVEEFDANN